MFAGPSPRIARLLAGLGDVQASVRRRMARPRQETERAGPTPVPVPRAYCDASGDEPGFRLPHALAIAAPTGARQARTASGPQAAVAVS